MTEDEMRCKLREGFDRCIAKGDTIRKTRPEFYQEAVETALDYYARMLRKDTIQQMLCELSHIPYQQIVAEEYEDALHRFIQGNRR